MDGGGLATQRIPTGCPARLRTQILVRKREGGEIDDKKNMNIWWRCGKSGEMHRRKRLRCVPDLYSYQPDILYRLLPWDRMVVWISAVRRIHRLTIWRQYGRNQSLISIYRVSTAQNCTPRSCYSWPHCKYKVHTKYFETRHVFYLTFLEVAWSCPMAQNKLQTESLRWKHNHFTYLRLSTRNIRYKQFEQKLRIRWPT